MFGCVYSVRILNMEQTKSRAKDRCHLVGIIPRIGVLVSVHDTG